MRSAELFWWAACCKSPDQFPPRSRFCRRWRCCWPPSTSPAVSWSPSACCACSKNKVFMSQGFITALYLAAGVLFIMSLGGLSAQSSARRGNMYGVIGMLIALAITALGAVHSYGLLVLVVAVGGSIGAALAKRVQMTAMPELVAALHSFVGAAAVLVGIASYLDGKTFPTHAEAI